jgi:hypothetical protein
MARQNLKSPPKQGPLRVPPPCRAPAGPGMDIPPGSDRRTDGQAELKINPILLFSENYRNEIVWGDSLNSRLSVFCLCSFLIFRFFEQESEEINFQILPEDHSQYSNSESHESEFSCEDSFRSRLWLACFCGSQICRIFGAQIPNIKFRISTRCNCNHSAGHDFYTVTIYKYL